jgi:hypothetical protein
LTSSTLIGHHQHTARDRKQPVPYSWQSGGPITLAGDNHAKPLIMADKYTSNPGECMFERWHNDDEYPTLYRLDRDVVVDRL